MRSGWLKLMDFLQTYILLRNKSLSTKLLFFSALIVVIPLTLVGFISYQRSAAVLESEERKSSMQIIEQVKSHIEYYVTDFEISTLRILNHPDVVRLMKMRSIEEIQESHIRESTVQVLKNAAYSRSDISNISLMLTNLQIIDTANLSSPYPLEELKAEYWYPSIPVDGTPKLFSRVIRWPDGRQEQVISIARRLMNPYSLEPAGVIIMDVNFKRIEEISQKVSIGRTGFLYMLDAENHYVYHPDLQQVGQQSDDKQFKQMLLHESGSMVSEERDRHLYTYSLSNYLGWRLVTVIPYSELTEGINYIGRTIFWTLVITLVIAYLLGISFAASLVRPIRRLHKYMKKVEIGDFSNQLEVHSNDEVGMLTRGFNKMVGRLESLLEEIYLTRLKETQATLRQKETELKVLESQLNPHFLYNSLETIRGMALDQDMEDIAGISVSLAKLLRYNLKNDKPTVTLREELAFCEMYLRVQRYRFEEKLEFRMKVPKWALEQSIVKLALQPIVENCMIHGIEPGVGFMYIDIDAKLEEGGNAYKIMIHDTGVGMSEAKLIEIRDSLEQKDVLAGGEHIGIVNVHRRISYLYGFEYGISIRSNEGKGTWVTIRLPFIPTLGERALLATS
jgi:two-component system sensor histidine kinase YesM